MKDKWLNGLHDRMSEFEMDPIDNLWEEIEKAEMRRVSTPKRPLVIWLKRVSAVVSAASVVAVLTFYLHDTSVFDMSLPEDGIALDNIEGSEHVIAVPPATSAINMQNAAVSSTEATIHKFIPVVDPCNEQETVQDQSGSSNNVVVDNNDIKQEDISADTVIIHRGKTPAVDNSRNNRNPGWLLAHTNRSHSGLSIGVYSSGGVNSNYTSIGHSDDIIVAGFEGTEWEDSPMLGILLYNKGKEISTRIRHRQPIRAGVSFTYKLNERLGIGSGLTYTNLTSDLTSGSDVHYLSGRQMLHYIGIPVNVSYDLFRWKRFQLYVTSGVLAEKCVSGKSETGYVIDNSTRQSKTEEVENKPFQFSINASAGIQLNITNAIGLYAEPGAIYYFNDGTEIQTIYKDKPWNFNLNLGLRFTFGQ